MKEEHVKGIVLRSIPYRDHQRILSLFSRELGLISLIVKKACKGDALTLTTPLCEGEYIFLKKQSELYPFKDGTILDSHLELRTELNFLVEAGEMCQSILKSQLPGKQAEKLYDLFSAFLKKIPLFKEPFVLRVVFQLKLLLLEGLISWEDYDHFLPGFSLNEWQMLKKIAHERSFQELSKSTLSKDLAIKVKELFQRAVE